MNHPLPTPPRILRPISRSLFLLSCLLPVACGGGSGQGGPIGTSPGPAVTMQAFERLPSGSCLTSNAVVSGVW